MRVSCIAWLIWRLSGVTVVITLRSTRVAPETCFLSAVSAVSRHEIRMATKRLSRIQLPTPKSTTKKSAAQLVLLARKAE